jgi:hypothetical protein
MIEQKNEKNYGAEETDQREIFSKAVRAGKRTYFFDVKSTRRNDYFLTITESKKRFHKDGHFFFEKHKVFLYKEDFEKFTLGFEEVMNFIESYRTGADVTNYESVNETSEGDEFTSVSFDDLESVEMIEKEREN